MLKLVYVVQIISGIFVIIAGFVAVWQYTYDRKKQRDFRDQERVQRAVDIAKYYKDNVLKYSRYMKDTMSDVGTLDIIENIKMSQIEHFDVHEMEHVFDKEQLKHIRYIRDEYGIDKEVDRKSVSYRPLEKSSAEDDETCATSTESKQEIGERYVRLMFRILNNLEIFAMYFVHETADESVVYQPLHMSYLEIVRMLYYDIAYANRNGARKYYINTIMLFNSWNKKSEEKKNAEISGIRSMAETGKILETDKVIKIKK